METKPLLNNVWSTKSCSGGLDGLAVVYLDFWGNHQLPNAGLTFTGAGHSRRLLTKHADSAARRRAEGAFQAWG